MFPVYDSNLKGGANQHFCNQNLKKIYNVNKTEPLSLPYSAFNITIQFLSVIECGEKAKELCICML
jgi:hypothetical protein